MNQAISSQSTGNAVESILEAAEKLFAEQSFAAVSMRQIGDQAGVSKANVFHHFGTKDKLYKSVIQRIIQASTKLLDELDSGEDDYRSRLSRFNHGHLNNILSNCQGACLLLQESMAIRSGHGQQMAAELLGKQFNRLVNLIDMGQQAGELRKNMDPAMVASMLVSANLFFFNALPIIAHLDTVDFANNPDKYAKGVIDLLFNGIAAGGQEG
ncbi:MAG: TetR/AcrR family transcriptional regulator [Xanthomonadales bacterium]|nr:TetR/AcrR family transcriptional regulator [Xanthomonadales bacterium]